MCLKFQLQCLFLEYYFGYWASLFLLPHLESAGLLNKASGGSRIFPRGGANSQSGCANLFFRQKTAWKWKNLDPQGGRASLAPPLRSATESGTENYGKCSGCFMIIRWWPISWFVYQWRHFTCQYVNVNRRDVILYHISSFFTVLTL